MRYLTPLSWILGGALIVMDSWVKTVGVLAIASGILLIVHEDLEDRLHRGQ